jgi:hypothetical protein
MCRSTCFGRLHAHQQELTTALTASGFTLERGDSSVVGRGLAGPTMTNHAAATTLQGKTTHSQALQPMQDLGRLKKSPPTTLPRLIL